MIRLKKGRLRWNEEDMVAMSRVLGPDAAAKQQIPLIDSVLKSAAKSNVLMSPLLAARLEDSVELRKELARLRRTPDVWPTGYPRKYLNKLWAHQRIALAYMDAVQSFLLADRPGVGKTPVAIMWAAQRMERRTLVITPNAAKYQWRREISRWTDHHHDVTILDGSIKQQNLQARANGWVIAHWEAMVHAADGILDDTWDIIIADEGHAIRNRNIQRTQNVFNIQTDHKLVLTGHPFFKSPDELWSILHFLYPERYTSYWTYFSMHILAKPKVFGGFDIQGARKPKLLRWELAPFNLHRTKRQVYKSLPPITRTPLYLELTDAHRTEYDQLKKQFFAKLRTKYGERTLPIPSVLARTTRLRQYLIDPGLLDGSAPSLKYPEVLQKMEDLDGPPVVFTSFRRAANRLKAFLEKRGKYVAVIKGGMTAQSKDKIQTKFLRGGYDAVIIVTQAGGTALNYGKYGYVIFLDMPWSYADMEQAEGRVDRPEEATGKLVPTTAWRIIVKGTYEERIEKKIVHRKEMFDEVFTIGEVEEMFG